MSPIYFSVSYLIHSLWAPELYPHTLAPHNYAMLKHQQKQEIKLNKDLLKMPTAKWT